MARICKPAGSLSASPGSFSVVMNTKISFPCSDWGRLPGVTSAHMATSNIKRLTQPESFVGGVSDGSYGAAAMDFDQLSTRGRKGVVLLRPRNGGTGRGHQFLARRSGEHHTESNASARTRARLTGIPPQMASRASRTLLGAARWRGLRVPKAHRDSRQGWTPNRRLEIDQPPVFRRTGNEAGVFLMD